MKKIKEHSTDLTGDISAMKLETLIESAAMAAISIGNNIVTLGGVLNEISERYGADGVDLTCSTLGLSKKLYAKFIATFRGVMHPSVALGSVPHCAQLESLTFEQQGDLIDNGVPYVESIGKTCRTKRIPLSKLDSLQIKQVFDDTRLRTEDEQYQFIKDSKKPAEPKAARIPKPAYEVRQGKLIIHRPITFKKDDLLKLALEM